MQERVVPELEKTSRVGDELAVGAQQSSLPPGTMADHFRIMRLLGRGGMGAVYLARDTVLGRRVALKMIHPLLLGSPGASERFLLEARTTARFSHPHIVSVYAVGECLGHPYLALEYLEGRTLREQLAKGRVSIREAGRLTLAVAEALKEAHRHRVLHRDLKPENVLLPRDGRPRVVDFGLAHVIADESSGETVPPAADWDPTEACSMTRHLSSSGSADPAGQSQESGKALLTGAQGRRQPAFEGTPPYMAPEQWQGAGSGEATDIWALGVMMFEMLSGRRPFSGRTVAKIRAAVTSPEPTPNVAEACKDVPTDLAVLIEALLDKSPQGRPSAAEVVQRLDDIFGQTAACLPETESPFRGLLPFSEEYSGFFFGREAEIDAVVERLRTEVVVAIVGASGAGKTSFAQAGVVPRLKEQAAWSVVRVRPGPAPFAALAARLLKEGSTASSAFGLSATRLVSETEAWTTPGAVDHVRLAEALEENPKRLALLLQERAAIGSARVLLIVDQLEEIYTLVEDEECRRRFMQAICGAADDPDEPVRVLLTIRDDFLVRVSEGLGGHEAISQVTVLHPPGEQQLREILLRPVKAVGYAYDDPGLVDEMIAAINGEPAALPLLQFATRMLWERRDETRCRLTRASYVAIGGVAGALATQAEGVMRGLSSEQLRLVRDLLVRLVTPQGTRRSAPAGSITEGLGPAAQGMLQRLVQARLISVRRSLGQHYVELAHESLIANWRQLTQWLDEGREELVIMSELAQAAELWKKRGCRAQEVWIGGALAELERNIERYGLRLGGEEAQFLAACRKLEHRRLRRRRVVLAGSIALLALIAATSTVAAMAFAEKEGEAVRLKEAAERQRAEAQTEGARAAHIGGRLLEARSKLRGALETQDSTAIRALWWRLEQEPLRWKRRFGSNLHDVNFSPNGAQLAAASIDGSIYLLDRQSLATRALRGPRDQVNSVSYSLDGRTLAWADTRGRVGLVNLQTGTTQLLGGHSSSVWLLAAAPDASLIASSSFDETVRLWDTRTGALVRTMRGRGRFMGLAFSPDGKRLAAGSADHTVQVWQVASDQPPQVFPAHRAPVHAVAFSPDATLLASGGEDKIVHLADAETGATLAVLSGHSDVVSDVIFTQDGRRLLSSSYDQSIRIWQTASRSQIGSLLGHTAGVLSLGLSPDGKALASTGSDASVRVWDPALGVNEREDAGHLGAAVSVDCSRDGRLIASGGADNTVRLWDTGSGEQLRVLRGHDNVVVAVKFSPDGKLLASAGFDRTIRLWDVASGGQQSVLLAHESAVYDLEFLPTGKRLVSAGFDGTVRLWDVASGALQQLFADHPDSVTGVAVSASGTLLAASGLFSDVWLRDLRSGEKIPAPGITRSLVGGPGWIVDVSFSSDGDLLAAGGDDGGLWVWDLARGAALKVVFPARETRALRPAFHPYAARVAVGYYDGGVRVWDLASQRSLELAGHKSEVSDVAFTRNGRMMVTAGDDGTVRLWDVSTGRPSWWGATALGSTLEALTHKGWTKVGEDAPNQPAAASKWGRRVEMDARMATEWEGLLCLHTWAQELQLWDQSSDKELARAALGPIDTLIATAGGCAALVEDKVQLVGRGGGTSSLASHVQAIAPDAGHVLAATAKQVVRIDATGKTKGVVDVGPGVTALTKVRGWLVLGFSDGMMELVALAGEQDTGSFVFEETGASRVVRLMPGPGDTVLAGYEDGLVGIWSLVSGTKLFAVKLHGPVRHMATSRHQLVVLSDLGGVLTLDLSIFHLPYCALLQRVWSQVPSRWESGFPVLRPPPQEHACAPL